MSSVLAAPASIGLLLLASTTPAATGKTHALVELLYHTAFLTSGDPPWTDLPLSLSPAATDKFAAIIPSRPRAYAMVALDCAGLTARGDLAGCTILLEPKDQGYEAAAQELMGALRTTRPFLAATRGKVKRILIHARLSNTNLPLGPGPCWPPSCSFLPTAPAGHPPTD